MYQMIQLVFLYLFIQHSYGALEDQPTYGYHMKIGIPKAVELKRLESSEKEGRIIGGSPVSKADVVPYQAGIIATLTTGWSSICGGSIISTTRVLTAAHCWWDGAAQTRLFTIVLGSLTIFSGGTRIDTSNVKVHPNWKSNLVHDIAIAAMPAVTFNSNIQSIPLPAAADANINFVGSTGTISGFGKTRNAQNGFPPTTALHQTTVNIITNAVCQNSYSVRIESGHICVSGDTGRGTCDGDSGGPLAVVHNSKRILVGVVSFGHSNGCEARMPSVFTRVTAYLSWIQSEM